MFDHGCVDMKWKLRPIYLFILIIAIIIVILFLWHLMPQKSEEPNVAFITSNNGTIIKLSEIAQEKSGIKVAKLIFTTQSQQYEAYGKVLIPQLLIDARNRFISAKSQSEKSTALLAASSKEYERIKKLSKHNDVSIKNLQTAEATFLNDKATASSVQNALQAEIDSAKLQWGDTIAHWISDGTQEYEMIINLKNFLLQATLPHGVDVTSPPAKALVKVNKQMLPAKVISAVPITDPQLQGLSFYFLIPHTPSLLPGMGISVWLPTTIPIQGVIVPRSAIVYWQGKPWVYVEKAPRQYQRVAINTQMPTENGFLVGKFDNQQPVVIEGAQVLLSQEILGVSTNAAPDED
jgi:hypothetical protein